MWSSLSFTGFFVHQSWKRILTKAEVLQINLNIDDTLITSRSHIHPSHTQNSRLLTSSLSLGVPGPRSSVSETLRSISFRFWSFIPPTPTYMCSLLPLVLSNKNTTSRYGKTWQCRRDRPIQYSTSDIIISFTSSPTPWSRSSLSHVHRFTCFFHNQTAMVTMVTGTNR